MTKIYIYILKCGCLGKAWLGSLIHVHTLLFWRTGGGYNTRLQVEPSAGFLGLALMQLIKVIGLFLAVKVVPAFQELFLILKSTNRNEDEHE